MTTVRGKTAIVTGGANGIGFQYCKQLLVNGAKFVAIMDLPNSNGESSVNKLNQEFGEGRALFFPSDVTKFAEFEVAFKEAVTALQGLDILVNNAGILNDHIWEKEIETNFTALVKNTLLGYDYMGKHKGGKGGIIVNVSSAVGLIPFPNLPVYTGTKYAVMGFTLSLKAHYETTGISVRVICPGVTDTPLIAEVENNFLDFVDNTKGAEFLRKLPRQSAQNVGEALIPIIEKGENGSVWMSHCNEPPFEVDFAKYENIRVSA